MINFAARRSNSGPRRPGPNRLAPLAVLIATCLMAAVVATGPEARPAGAQTRAPEGAGFRLNASDLSFILRQIQISENNAETGQPLLGPGPFQIEDATLPFGLRTVDGTFNNLLPNQSRFGSADRVFPRMTSPLFRPAEALTADLDGPGPATVGAPTSYASNKGFVEDSQPRVASNLIVDQTTQNPAAVAAAGFGATPEGGANGPLFIPNVAPDAGLSAPYNSWFTLFGQFFDHGLDLTNKGGGTIYTPLKDDDPLISGPDGVRGNADDLPANLRFMALTRTLNQPGPDGRMGTDDDVKEHTNQTTAFVDQNQTYTSNASHQVFLREYDATDAAALAPKLTGKLLDGGAAGGLATWTRIKAQARNELGIQLRDLDVLNVPKLKTDAYGRFLAGPNGYPQIELSDGGVLDGDPAAEGGNGVLVPAGAKRTGHAFLDDIAHHAAPKSSRGTVLTPDLDPGTTNDGDPATYDDEMLDAHFIAGDGRTNENIGLTAIHTIFHSEHNRLVTEIDGMINALPAADQLAWKNAKTADGEYWDYGERLFQAARFVTEMEYQHLAFEEFARKVQPQVNVFAGYNESIDPAIVAEFAHATYRFGHSLLNEKVERVNANGSRNDIGLIEGFLNPPEFLDGATYATADKAVGAIARGMTRQTGNELDEFVTEALRNNLLGLPLDLATINMLRGRDTGTAPLNQARKQFFAASGDAALAPYANWVEFGRAIRHVNSLENFVAAYGTHDSIAAATTNATKRKAARALITGLPDAPGDPVPADSADFMNATGTWASRETGLNLVDFWTGGLAEKQAPFGGLLGSTMNVVFETQLENLQDGDRFYYLSRTAGLNLLVQLEGNSFAELVQRNSDASGLPADVFSKPDFRFDLAAQTNPDSIVDDPSTPEYDETTLLVRTPDKTIRFNGPEHVNWIGTEPSATPAVSGIDKVWSSEGDDTLRGEGGDDRLEGAAGNDQFIGGLGNDILTDTFGDDVLKGGEGHDAMSSGQGFDLNQGGLGDDFVVGGSDPTETFGGPGDDMIFAGASADIVFGDDGDDWIQGGGQADLLQGDNGAPFQNDPNKPGSDVIIGEGGNDDYDAEGGNDIMVAGPGIDRSEGLLGFDWVTYKGDPQPATADMFFTGFLPPSVEALRDRFDVVEGLSGYRGDDVLRGDDRGVAPADMVGHELKAAGIAQIAGLQDVLDLGATSYDAGNIILGGAGSDIIEGRGGSDVIDGDKWLNVQLRVPDLANPGATKLIDDMSDIRADVLAGRIDGGQIEIVRTIETGAANIDTAVFSGTRAQYGVDNRGSSVVVTHLAGTRPDGIDRLVNVERLSFTGDGQVVEVVNIPTNGPPSGTLDFDDTTPTENQTLTAAVALTDPDGIASAIAVETQVESAAGVWEPVAQGRVFTPGAAEVGRRLRLVATFVDGDGVQESFTSTPTVAIANLNDPPNGAPVLQDTTPQEGVRFSATVGSITDKDGLGRFTYEWQQNGPDGTGDFAVIAGPDGPDITPGSAQVGRRLRLVVSYTDGQGTLERVPSAPSAVVRRLDAGVGPDPGPVAPSDGGSAAAPGAGSAGAAPPAPGPPGGEPTPGPNATAVGASGKSVFYAGPALVRVSRRGVASILVACSRNVAVRCLGTVQLRDARGRSFGRARFSVPAGKRARVPVKLAAVRLKGLRSAKTPRSITAFIEAVDQAGWAGTARRQLKIVLQRR